MRRTLVTLIAAGLLGAAIPAASADDPSPQIVDQAGDANGLNGQWYDYGTVGTVLWFVYDTVFAGDPFGEGTQTDVSYAPGDLREGRIETMYEAVPVGEDGIDYRATGVRVRIATEETPAAPDDTELRIGLFLTQYDAAARVCPTRISTEIPGSGDPGPVSWFRDTVQSCDGVEAEREPAGWTAFRDGKGVVIEMPAAGLDPSAASFFDEGAAFVEPHAFTEILLATIDATRPGPDFMVGEDMPADVPCTKGCPGT